MSDARDTILLVEDFEDDVYALKRALKKAGIALPLEIVVNGQEAVDYLSGAEGYSDRARFPLPFLVLLDLKMPLMNGFEVLAWIRTQREFDALSVTILSGSDEKRDHERASDLGAQGYLVKPATPDELRQLVEQLRPTGSI